MESRQGVALRKSSVHSINTEKTDVCIYIYMYMVPPKKVYNFSVFTGIYSVLITFWQIFLRG